MNKDHKQDSSELFLVRFWHQATEDRTADCEGREWQGRLQHVATGEAHNFRDYATLVELLARLLTSLSTGR
jgi:hypothetical protein